MKNAMAETGTAVTKVIDRIPREGMDAQLEQAMKNLIAAAGTSRAVITKLNAELTRILNTDDMKEFLAKQGTEVRAGTPEALGAFIVNEKSRWAKVVKEAGVKAD